MTVSYTEKRNYVEGFWICWNYEDRTPWWNNNDALEPVDRLFVGPGTWKDVTKYIRENCPDAPCAVYTAIRYEACSWQEPDEKGLRSRFSIPNYESRGTVRYWNPESGWSEAESFEL